MASNPFRGYTLKQGLVRGQGRFLDRHTGNPVKHSHSSSVAEPVISLRESLVSDFHCVAAQRLVVQGVITMRAVYDEELSEYLDNLGILAAVQKGSVVCVVCKQPVTFENLQAIVPKSGDIKLVCDRPNCMKRFTEEESLQ